MNFQTRLFPRIFPSTWFGRLAASLIIAAVVIIGLFFLVIAVVAGSLIAAAVLARLWWVARKLRSRRNARVIEGSFSVDRAYVPAISSTVSDKRPAPTPE
jgi:predicted lipid-binding transport protein (Tim44 family)